jgi:hypothetical protein
MKMCYHTTATCTQCSSTIVLATATICSVGLYSSRLVYATAAVLMLVAMLSTFACAGEPFKTKLIFCEFHNNFYLVRDERFELPTTVESGQDSTTELITLAADYLSYYTPSAKENWLQWRESNPRPPGYEPGQIPLLTHCVNIYYNKPSACSMVTASSLSVISVRTLSSRIVS